MRHALMLVDPNSMPRDVWPSVIAAAASVPGCVIMAMAVVPPQIFFSRRQVLSQSEAAVVSWRLLLALCLAVIGSRTMLAEEMLVVQFARDRPRVAVDGECMRCHARNVFDDDRVVDGIGCVL